MDEKIRELRKKIDIIDEQIVELINQRAKLAHEIISVKEKTDMSIYDPRREEEILEHVSNINHGPLYNDDIRRIYEIVLETMKSVEE